MNDNTFWEGIYKKNATKLLGICKRYVSNDDLAKDLMHESFISAINKQKQYSGKGSFDGWLYRITVNTILMYLREQKKLLKSSKNYEYFESVSNEPEDDILPENARSIIENSNFEQIDLIDALDQLPEHHRSVFNLYVFENLTHKEIGEMLEISPGTSKSHLARARKKIQKILIEKSKNMKKEKENKRFFILFFFNNKNNFIDNIYRNKLGNYNVPVDFETLDLSKIRTAQPLNFEKIRFKFILKKILLYSTVAIITTFLTLFLWGFLNQNDIGKSIELKTSDYIKNQDNLIKTNIKIADSLKNDSLNQVIERKTIYIEKPVVVNDTLIQYIEDENE